MVPEPCLGPRLRATCAAAAAAAVIVPLGCEITLLGAEAGAGLGEGFGAGAGCCCWEAARGERRVMRAEAGMPRESRCETILRMSESRQ